MAGNRMGRVAAAGALLMAGWGGLSPARAQASGTLQASVTVVDDAVSRSVSAALPLLVQSRLESSPPSRSVSISLPGSSGTGDGSSVRAIIRELPFRGDARRLRVDIIYLN